MENIYNYNYYYKFTTHLRGRPAQYKLFRHQCKGVDIYKFPCHKMHVCDIYRTCSLEKSKTKKHKIISKADTGARE